MPRSAATVTVMWLSQIPPIQAEVDTPRLPRLGVRIETAAGGPDRRVGRIERALLGGAGQSTGQVDDGDLDRRLAGADIAGQRDDLSAIRRPGSRGHDRVTGRATDLDGVTLRGHLVDRIGAVDDDVRDDPVRLEDPNDPDDGSCREALLAIGE